MNWDEEFEKVADAARKQFDRDEHNPRYKAKREAEQAKIDAGIGVYTAEEIAAHELEEEESDGE